MGELLVEQERIVPLETRGGRFVARCEGAARQSLITVLKNCRQTNALSAERKWIS